MFDHTTETPLTYVAGEILEAREERKRIEIIRILLDKGANPNFPNKLGYTPLINAASRGHLEVVKKLLEHKKIEINKSHPKVGTTALMYAALHGHVKVVEEILKDEYGCEPNITDDQGRTALMCADLLKQVDLGKREKVKTLITEKIEKLRLEEPEFRWPFFNSPKKS